MRVLGCLLLFMCLGAHAQNEVYKWVDADGRIQYGNEPPKGVNAKPVSGGVTVMPAFKAPAVPSGAAKPKVEERPAPEASGPAKPSVPVLSTEDAKRLKMLEICKKNRGANCEDDVDALLSGADPSAFVPVPGWSQPPIRPSRANPVNNTTKPAPVQKERKVSEPRRSDSSSSSARREDKR